nr:cellulase-like family protein [Kineosporia rhizophila]
MWDFSWYTLAGPGEPYEDLDVALEQTVARGYNTVRICAAPMLLFGELGLDDLAESLPIEGMGGHYGQRTRWYAVPGGYQTPLRARFFELLEKCRRRGVSVILSSWEYQQSPAFAGDPRWHRALQAIPHRQRLDELAAALGRMLNAIREAGLEQVVALVELHNEVDFSHVPNERDSITRAVAHLQQEHPAQLVTVSWGKPPHLAMHTVPDGLGAGQFHVYSYGVLDALQEQIDIRATGTDAYPNAALRALQRPASPSFQQYGRPAAWKLEATVVTDQMLYGYDTIDAVRWDAWLYQNYGRFHEVMRREIASRVTAIAAWGRWKDVPVLVGEGWIGYTPLEGTFEEGPIGKALAEHGVRTAAEQGLWGVLACSNAAPHHPMWQDAAWQIEINEEFRSA